MKVIPSVLTTGLLVVKRTSFMEPPFKGTPRKPSLPMQTEEVLRRYKGFEGIPWPEQLAEGQFELMDGLAPLGAYEEVQAYYDQLRPKMAVDCLILSHFIQTIPAPPHRDFIFAGLDFGAYFSEGNHFSIIFHEILFGVHPELRGCAGLLNKYLLFDSLEAWEQVAGIRAMLVAAGQNLETDDDEGFWPIAIYLRE